MPKSAYLRTKIVRHALGQAAYTMPAGTHLALFTSDPTVNNTGTEVVGGSYARQPITWGTEADGRLPHTGTITFSSLPATTITHWAIFDASSGGNLLYFAPFEVAINRTAGQSLAIAAGNVAITEG